MRVGYDLDGVGYVFGASVRDYLRTIDIEVAEPTDEFCTDWNFFEFWGMNESDFAKHCDDGTDAGIVFGPGDHLTRPHFFDSIRLTKAMGHEVVVVTHRFQGAPGSAERNTEAWLEPVRDCIDELYYSKDKTIGNTDLFVEDSKPNYDALTEAGMECYLINRPWNGPYDDDRNRIGDIRDYTAIVAGRTLGYHMV